MNREQEVTVAVAVAVATARVAVVAAVMMMVTMIIVVVMASAAAGDCGDVVGGCGWQVQQLAARIDAPTVLRRPGRLLGSQRTTGGNGSDSSGQIVRHLWG